MPMIDFNLGFDTPKRTIVFRGGLGLLVILALVILPYYFAESITAEQAAQIIRDRLFYEDMISRQVELQRTGRRVPDEGMAERWQRQIEGIEAVQFRNVEIKRSLFVYPFRRRSSFAVRFIMTPPTRQVYYWIGNTANVLTVRESSSLWWYLRI